jgi:hypothetical protein
MIKKRTTDWYSLLTSISSKKGGGGTITDR